MVRVRHERAIVVLVHDSVLVIVIVTRVAERVLVVVLLTRIGLCRAVVCIVQDPIAVGVRHEYVERLGIVAPDVSIIIGVLIAHVPQLIAVRVSLILIGYRRAIVPLVCHSIPIRIRKRLHAVAHVPYAVSVFVLLVVIRVERTVVLSIIYPVFVQIVGACRPQLLPADRRVRALRCTPIRLQNPQHRPVLEAVTHRFR